jgi:peptidoglycan/LPS O-acetylase OafA/YrhL
MLIVLITVIRSRQKLFYTIAALALLGWLYRQYFVSQGAYPERLYMGLDMRIDTLMIGAALAVGHASSTVRKHMEAVDPRLLGMASVATMALALHIGFTRAFWPIDNFIWINTVAAIGFALMYWDICLHKGGSLKGLLGNPLLVFLGKRSYGVYLWHYPIMQAMHKFDINWIAVWLLGSGLTVLAAYLSFRYIETPIMDLRRGLPPRRADQH